MFDGCMYFNAMDLGRQIEKLWTQTYSVFGLTPAQAFMVRAALKRPGASPSELAALLAIARATATRSIDGLEKKGLLRREKAERDGRECEIHPTDEAIGLQRDLEAASTATTSRLKNALGEDFFQSFIDQMKVVKRQL